MAVWLPFQIGLSPIKKSARRSRRCQCVGFLPRKAERGKRGKPQLSTSSTDRARAERLLQTFLPVSQTWLLSTISHARPHLPPPRRTPSRAMRPSSRAGCRATRSTRSAPASSRCGTLRAQTPFASSPRLPDAVFVFAAWFRAAPIIISHWSLVALPFFVRFAPD